MHTEEPKGPIDDGRYEKRDLNVVGIGKATFFLYAVFFGCTIAAWFIWNALSPKYKSDPRVVEAKRIVPGYPNPLLQSNISVRTDIAVMRQEEEKILTSSGVNPDGSTRIPIDQAMKALAEKGFKPTGAQVPANTVGTTVQQNALSEDEAMKTLQSSGKVGQ